MDAKLLHGFRVGNYEVEPLAGQIRGPEGIQRVQPKVMDVLLCLAEHPGEVVERDGIAEQVWNGRLVADESLTRCISELRQALNDQRAVRRYVQTIPTRGYRLIAPVAPLEVAADATPVPVDDAGVTAEASPSTQEPEGEGFQSKLAGFWFQLRRRRVMNSAAAYLVCAWMVVEATSLIVEKLDGPEWLPRLAIFIAFFGLPVILVLAWIFDIERTDARHVDKPTWGGAKRQRKRMAKSRVGGPPSPDSAVASVAVLPFNDLTNDSAHAYLAEGIATELHSTLSKVDRLRIVSRQSSFAFRGSRDIRELGGRLHADYVISGSIQYSKAHIRVIADFDNAQDGIQLWSQTYDREVDDILRVELEIAQAIVSTFGGERLRAEILEARGEPTKSLNAWGLVQRARAYLLEYTSASLTEALHLLRRAVKIDPDYAAAHATLGMVLAERVINGFSGDPREDMREALAAVGRAQTLSPNDPFVLKSSGAVFAYSGDYEQSIAVLHRAVHLAPFDFGSWGYLGWPMVLTGQAADLEELHHILDRLLEIAPHHPGVSYWLFHKSVAYSSELENQAAVEYAKKSVDEQFNFSLAWMQYANALGNQNQRDQAVKAVARCTTINPAMTPAHYASLMRTMSDVPSVVESRLEGLQKARLLPPGADRV